MNTTVVISGLNDILTRSYDALKGYQEAASNVSDTKLQKWLSDNANIRNKAINRLESEIKLLGGTPNDGSSFLGTLHRAWIDFKSSITEGDRVVLTECLRGEEYALEDYNRVLDEIPMAMSTTLMLKDQRQEIEESLKALRILETTLIVTEA